VTKEVYQGVKGTAKGDNGGEKERSSYRDITTRS
jgi:hypothetical protein